MGTQIIKAVLAGILAGLVLFMIPFFILKVIIIVLLIRIIFRLAGWRRRGIYYDYDYLHRYESITGEDQTDLVTGTRHSYRNKSGLPGENREIKIN